MTASITASTAAPESPVALVTGATSGIGLAVARDLATRGHRVFLCARTAEAVEETVAKLRADGLEVSGTAADVRSKEQVRSLVAAAVAAYGPITVLVNNAGRSGGGPTADISDELWYDVIDTNLNSVFLLTREVLKHGGLTEAAAAGRHGRIISIASTAGKQGVLLGAPYSASKHAVVGFTKALGKELAPSGITVNAVCPGYVETPMAERVRAGYAAAWDTTDEDVRERFEAKIPLGRYSTPEEVAGLVGYLTTDLAASITAQALNVCGGLGNF
ncbi:3-oxoacyl-ACP reductase FabG [Streptomyces sp. NPDC056921]|uniref:3-oxoacyl-ACP reductase FabG n=1 Tax=Streptomyces sp. NPDC056921 TaxID=3345966 RepID=UPI0036372C24